MCHQFQWHHIKIYLSTINFMRYLHLQDSMTSVLDILASVKKYMRLSVPFPITSFYGSSKCRH